jgi:hypothetical protein
MEPRGRFPFGVEHFGPGDEEPDAAAAMEASFVKEGLCVPTVSTIWL